MNAGTILRAARESAGLTQAELGARLNTSQPAIARLESHNSNPRLATIMRAVAATGHRLNVSVVPAPSSGIDESLLASSLRRSPAERLADFSAAYRSVGRLKSATQRR